MRKNTNCILTNSKIKFSFTIISKREQLHPSFDLNLRHFAVEGVEEERQDEVVQVVLGRLLQHDGQPLQKGHRGLHIEIQLIIKMICGT